MLKKQNNHFSRAITFYTSYKPNWQWSNETDQCPIEHCLVMYHSDCTYQAVANPSRNYALSVFQVFWNRLVAVESHWMVGLNQNRRRTDHHRVNNRLMVGGSFGQGMSCICSCCLHPNWARRIFGAWRRLFVWSLLCARFLVGFSWRGL